MKFTRHERYLITLCLARCNTCSESLTCKLKAKLQQLDEDELDGIVYDLLAGYYGKLYAGKS